MLSVVAGERGFQVEEVKVPHEEHTWSFAVPHRMDLLSECHLLPPS